MFLPRIFTPLASLGFFITLLSPDTASADWQDDIGLTLLRAELGSAAPDGSGVQVSHVEAPSSAGNHLPQAGNTPITGSGNYTGKTFTNNTTSSTGSSGHAATVANFFYGNSGGTAPGVTSIHNYGASDFINEGLLTPENFSGTPLAPGAETSLVQNHSWIANLGEDSPAELEDILRRLDFAIDRDGFVACVGLNNGSGNAIPALMAHAFNVISVGLTSGNHSRGTTAVELSTPGRTKPDIVAPQSATSWSTGIASGAAAILFDTPEGAGQHPETIKAALLAGATKDEFGASWSQTPARPLDAVFGAGELNIYQSHRIITAGQQNPSSSTDVATSGWDYHPPTSFPQPVTYFFSVPAGSNASDVSIVLTWNRTITDSQPGPGFSPSETVHDLNLKLREASGFTPLTQIRSSDSASDNVEHIYAGGLPPGQYAIQVDESGSQTTDFALAWRSTISPDPDITLTDIQFSEGCGICEIPVSLSSPSGLDITVNYTTTAGSATPGQDYTTTSGSLTIPAGQMSASVFVPVNNNSSIDGSRTFSLTFSGATNAGLPDSTLVATILDNDPEPAISVGDISIAETAGSALFTFTLSAVTPQDVSFDYTTTDGNAGAPADYTAVSGRVTIPSGSTQSQISITVANDQIPEVNENFSIDLSAPLNGTLTDTQATATIIDEDFETLLATTSLDLSFNGSSGTITWQAVPGRLYSIQTSTDLVLWTGVPGQTPITANTPSISVTLALGSGTETRRFYRVSDITNVSSL